MASESMTIRKVTDNVEILLGGGALSDLEDGTIVEDISFTLTESNGNETEYSVEEFSNMIEYIEPKTKREVALELRITVLEDKLAHATSVSTPVLGSEVRPRKIPVTLSESQEQIVVDYYLEHKDSKIKMKDIALVKMLK